MPIQSKFSMNNRERVFSCNLKKGALTLTQHLLLFIIYIINKPKLTYQEPSRPVCWVEIIFTGQRSRQRSSSGCSMNRNSKPTYGWSRLCVSNVSHLLKVLISGFLLKKKTIAGLITSFFYWHIVFVSYCDIGVKIKLSSPFQSNDFSVYFLVLN